MLCCGHMLLPILTVVGTIYEKELWRTSQKNIYNWKINKT